MHTDEEHSSKVTTISTLQSTAVNIHMYHLHFNITKFCIFTIWCVLYSCVSYDSQNELFPSHSFNWLVRVVETHCEIGIEFSNTVLLNFKYHRSQDFMKLSLMLEVVNSLVLVMDFLR
jgi:hypothetical protein